MAYKVEFTGHHGCPKMTVRYLRRSEAMFVASQLAMHYTQGRVEWTNLDQLIPQGQTGGNYVIANLYQVTQWERYGVVADEA